MSIFDRIGSMASTEWGQASNLAHETFQSHIGEHRHVGRAIVATVATICRNHPNLIGIGTGLLVERLLVEEKQHHDAELAAEGASPAQRRLSRGVKLPKVRPGKIAWEVFGALILLKLAATGARWFRHRYSQEVWFAPAARIGLISGPVAAYYVARAIRAPRVSAWRNAMAVFFGTRALRPLLNPPRRPRPTSTT